MPGVINGSVVSGKTSGVKSVPNQTHGSICCGDPLGNEGEAKSFQFLMTNYNRKVIYHASLSKLKYEKSTS